MKYKMNNQELQHHGVIGMKWGVRRYQNKDGTLTPRGKKRYEKELEKLSKEERILKTKLRTKAKTDKLEAKRRELDETKKALSGKSKSTNETSTTVKKPESKRIKPASEMSDDELAAVVRRLQNEQKLRELQPKHKSVGKKFVEHVFHNVLVPVATDYAKKQLLSTLTEAAEKRKPKPKGKT